MSATRRSSKSTAAGSAKSPAAGSNTTGGLSRCRGSVKTSSRASGRGRSTMPSLVPSCPFLSAALAAEAGEFQNPVPHLVAAGRELPFRGKRFARAFETYEQSAALAREVVVRGEIRVEPRRPAPRPDAQAPVRDEKLEIAVDRPEGNPRN